MPIRNSCPTSLVSTSWWPNGPGAPRHIAQSANGLRAPPSPSAVGRHGRLEKSRSLRADHYANSAIWEALGARCPRLGRSHAARPSAGESIRLARRSRPYRSPTGIEMPMHQGRLPFARLAGRCIVALDSLSLRLTDGCSSPQDPGLLGSRLRMVEGGADGSASDASREERSVAHFRCRRSGPQISQCRWDHG